MWLPDNLNELLEVVDSEGLGFGQEDFLQLVQSDDSKVWIIEVLAKVVHLDVEESKIFDIRGLSIAHLEDVLELEGFGGRVGAPVHALHGCFDECGVVFQWYIDPLALILAQVSLVL